MSTESFCYWLMGCLEMGGGDSGLSAAQVATVRRHLDMVFAHDIDPKAGGPEVQDHLDYLHGPSNATLPFPTPKPLSPAARPRC